MAGKFEISEVNSLAKLTGNGANMAAMGITSFEPAQAAVSLSKPSPVISGPGGLS